MEQRQGPIKGFGRSPAHELIRLHGRGVLGARAGLARAVALGDGVHELGLVRVQRPVLACTRRPPTVARHGCTALQVKCLFSAQTLQLACLHAEPTAWHTAS